MKAATRLVYDCLMETDPDDITCFTDHFKGVLGIGPHIPPVFIQRFSLLGQHLLYL
jgi:hypothetical protein